MKIFVDLSDERNKTVYDILSKKYSVAIYGEKEILKGDVIVFSPAKKFSEQEVLALPDQVTVYCGNVSESIKNMFAKKNIKHINMLDDELFAIKNACLTAEGVLSLIISETTKSIFDIKVLILGGGRIAKATVFLLKKVGVYVGLASYNEKEYYTANYFADKCYLGKEYLSDISLYDVIINTRPFFYFDQISIDKVKKGALFLETASVECLDKTKATNFKYVLAPKLPQRFSCYSAGKIIADKIIGEI